MTIAGIQDPNDLLTINQLSNLCIIVNDFDESYGYFQLNFKVDIVISDKTPRLNIPLAENDLRKLHEELDKDISNERREAVRKKIDEIQKKIIALGRYFPAEKKIELYYRNIEFAYPTDLDNALLYVFAHEMYHAYYHYKSLCPSSIAEVEEPLAEYGTLHFFKCQGYGKIFNFAQRSIRSKKRSKYISYYGFGDYIFTNIPKSMDIIDIYSSSKDNINQSDQCVKDFCSGFNGGYPHNNEAFYFDLLKHILSPKFFTKPNYQSIQKTKRPNIMKTNPQNPRKEKFCINGMGVYTKIGVVREVIKIYLSKNSFNSAYDAYKGLVADVFTSELGERVFIATSPQKHYEEHDIPGITDKIYLNKKSWGTPQSNNPGPFGKLVDAVNKNKNLGIQIQKI